MATIPFRYIRIVLGCTTPKASDRDVEVQSISPRYKRDANNNVTEKLDGYNLDYLAVKGCSQTIKLPVEAKANVEKVLSYLSDKQTIVRVKLISPEYKLYDMERGGQSFKGISAKADNIEITKVETPDIDDEIDFD